MIDLYGCRGCGSTVIEALLELAGVAYERHPVVWEDRAAWERLKAVNPAGHVPTLRLDDGTILTESAGIALWIAHRYPSAQLLPDDPAGCALAYRWMVSFATNIYVPIIVGDFPDRWVDGATAEESLKAKARQRLLDAWAAFETAIDPRPFLLGDRLSVLDVYVAMISRWRPGRAWIVEHCPRVMVAVTATEANATVASVWARNFD